MTEKQPEIEAILDKPLSEIVKLMDEQLLHKLLSLAFNLGVKIGQQMATQALNDALRQKPYLDN